MINNELYVRLQEHDDKGRFSKNQVKNKVLISNNAEFYIFVPDSEFVLESPEFDSIEELDAKIDEYFVKDENGQFRCTFCTYVQSKRSAIKTHVETHIQTIWFPCQECDAKPRTRSALRSHRNSKHESQSVIQDHKSDIVLESQNYNTIDELNAKHESQSVIQEPKSNIVFESSEFNGIEELNERKSVIQEPKSDIVLESPEFDSIEELDAKILQEYIVIDENGKFKCSFCNFVRARSVVKAHVERHIQTIWFPCPECDAKPRTRNNLRTHKYNVHGL